MVEKATLMSNTKWVMMDLALSSNPCNCFDAFPKRGLSCVIFIYCHVFEVQYAAVTQEIVGSAFAGSVQSIGWLGDMLAICQIQQCWLSDSAGNCQILASRPDV